MYSIIFSSACITKYICVLCRIYPGIWKQSWKLNLFVSHLLQVHSPRQRQCHKPTRLQLPQGFQSTESDPRTPPREKLELFAVLCIETSHYVSFVKYGPQTTDWIFFDSMADRVGKWKVLLSIASLFLCLHKVYIMQCLCRWRRWLQCPKSERVSWGQPVSTYASGSAGKSGTSRYGRSCETALLWWLHVPLPEPQYGSLSMIQLMFSTHTHKL